MKQLNPLKIYAVALFNLLLPHKIRYKFSGKRTPIENLAIGTIMTRIVYWRLLFYKTRSKRTIFFTQYNKV